MSLMSYPPPLLFLCFNSVILKGMSKIFFTLKKRTLLVAGVLAGAALAKMASNSPTYEREPSVGSFFNAVHADVPLEYIPPSGGGDNSDADCGDGGGGGCGG
jgi:hypothetical protein